MYVKVHFRVFSRTLRYTRKCTWTYYSVKQWKAPLRLCGVQSIVVRCLCGVVLSTSFGSSSSSSSDGGHSIYKAPSSLAHRHCLHYYRPDRLMPGSTRLSSSPHHGKTRLLISAKYASTAQRLVTVMLVVVVVVVVTVIVQTDAQRRLLPQQQQQQY